MKVRAVKHTYPGPWRDGARRFVRNQTAVVSLVVLLAVMIACICAPLLTHHDPILVDLAGRNQLPSSLHLLGTDVLGRDIFARMLYGGRVTFAIAFGALAMAAVAGSLLGIAAGFFGGALDAVVMRVSEALSAVPTVLLAVAIEAALGWGKGYYMYAMALSFTPTFAKVLRAAVMSIMGSEYIEAARALGVGEMAIIRRHVLHNVAAPFLVQLTASAAESLLGCTIIGYLKLGVAAPTPEWGAMVAAGYESLWVQPLAGLAPCIAIVVCALALNLLGNGLRDAFDPRERIV